MRYWHLKILVFQMIKIIARVSLIPLLAILVGCQSTREFSNSFDNAYTNKRAKLTFYTPNFSAHHVPPLMRAFAYVDSYLYDDFCTKDKKVIGKASVNRDKKTQSSWLPYGKIVANIGYYVAGAGSLTGDSYYLLNIDPSLHYRVTLTEARPLVTSYSVLIETDKSAPNILGEYSSAKKLCDEHSKKTMNSD